MALATRPNILNWFIGGEAETFPRPFDDCRKTPLVTYVGEETAFYINLVTGFDTGSTVSVVTLINEATSAETAVGTQSVLIDELPSEKMTVYGKVVCPVVSVGYYRWKIVIDGVTLLSTKVEVMSEAEAKAATIRVQCRNNETIQGIRYAWMDAAVPYLTGRIPAVLMNPEISGEDSNYTEVTTGEVQSFNTGSQRTLKFRTNYIDDNFYQGLATMLRHDTLLFNGVPVVRNGAIERSVTGRGALAPANFNVFDLTYAEPLTP